MPPFRAAPGSLLIAGGGIGGLATALALAKAGIGSHVLEQRANFAEAGAGIQIGPNGTRILAALGVAEPLAPMTAAPAALRIMEGASGREINRLPLGDWIAERHGAPYWTAHRADLHAALLARVEAEPLIRLSMASGVATAQSTASGVTVGLSDGGSFDGTGLIAADGVWSQLRRTVATAERPRPTGRSAARAVLSAAAMPPALAGPFVTIWLRPNAHVVHYPVRAGREVALVFVTADPEDTEGWNAPVPPDWIGARAAGFPRPLQDLLAAAGTWRKWSLVEAPPIPRWTQGRIALLGDAAHPVLPFLAQGAVQALEDAAALALHVSRAEKNALEQAFLAYERHRRPRALRVAAASARNGRHYHLDAARARIRNAVLKAAPGRALMISYDWLYGWRAD